MNNEYADFASLFLNNTPLFDVRAPVEFDKGAIPNAINLPLMDDDQRQQVGTCYKEKGQDAAISLGRELVTPSIQAERVKDWLAFTNKNPDGYLYCFRGGLRSRITQQWIAEGGTDYPFIKGGYKAMRQFLIDNLSEQSQKTPLVLISGRTGTGKTLLLHKLQRTIDLEGLANHRGSSFGNMLDAQPTTINFENALSIELLKLNHQQKGPIFIEAEGKMIGRLQLPIPFWEKMKASPTVVLHSSIAERVKIGIDDYILDLLNGLMQTLPRETAFEQLSERHNTSLFRIRKRLGGVRYEQAQALLDHALKEHQEKDNLEAYYPFIELLLTQYYDPMYDYQLETRQSKALFEGNADEIIDWSNEYLKNYTQ